MRRLAAALVLGLLAACAEPQAAGEGPPEGCILDPPSAVIGGPIDLIRQDGQAVTQADFAGRPALLYFGFAYCPDICPLALQSAKIALERAGPAAASVQPALVTLDPERDTPPALARYIASDVYPPSLIGLTGSLEQTKAAASAFKVAWRKNEEPESAAQYLIDHSSFFYLMDGDWRLDAMYPSSLSPEGQGTCLRLALAASP